MTDKVRLGINGVEVETNAMKLGFVAPKRAGLRAGADHGARFASFVYSLSENKRRSIAAAMAR